jgi:biopolymer transport protein ExbD
MQFASVTIVLIATVLLTAMSVGAPFHSPLPRVHQPEIILGVTRKDAIIISVYRNGEVWFRNERITASLVSTKIQDHSQKGGTPKRVYVEADGYAKYQLVSEVLDQIRAAGIENVSFVVSPWSGLPH